MLKKAPNFYLQTTDLAKLAGCTRQRIVRLIKKKKIKGHRKKGSTEQGNRWQIELKECIRWLLTEGITL